MLTKRCGKCGSIKNHSDFHKNSASKDGLCSRCKMCQAAYCKEYYQKNKGKFLETAQRRAANNQGEIKEYKRKWYQSNSKKVNASKKDWIQKNPDRHKANQEKWRLDNGYRLNHYSSKRRARERLAGGICNPEHLEEIFAIYRKAKILTKDTGIIHHVDHIFPLRAKNCSGLHVPWNLQIIPAEQNLKKNNKVPDNATGLAFLRIAAS